MKDNLQIANYVYAGRYGSGGVIGGGSKQLVIQDAKLWETIVIISALWKQPTDKENIIELSKQKLNLEHLEYLDECINILEEGNFLIKEGVFNRNDRFSRNWLYYNYMGASPDLVQTNLHEKSVTIIGCGGIGNHISQMLTTSGINNLTLVDDDHIELSNLTRQYLFSEKDINQKKTEVLKRELESRNGDANIRVLNININGIEDVDKIPRSDLYIISADSPLGLIDWINESCVKRKQAYINIGYINDISVVGPFYIPGITSCLRCSNILISEFKGDPLEIELRALRKEYKAATVSSVNGVAASYAFGDIIKYLGDFGEILSRDMRIGIHSSKPEIEMQPIPINHECTVCG